LKARREARGLTQRALAERIGVTPQRISLVELNQATLSLPQCTAAAEALGADQTELLAMAVSTPIEFSREVPDEKSLVGRVSVISRRVDRGSYFSAAGRGGVAVGPLLG
jgi:transcriptional regulator with XRE-family HTH domain